MPGLVSDARLRYNERRGEMVERLKAPVLKTGVDESTEGSNPSLSVSALERSKDLSKFVSKPED
jgi:hypothetical protein